MRRCLTGCTCGKHTLRNDGQFKPGVALQAGTIHSPEVRAKIRAARALQVNVVGGGPAVTEAMIRFLRRTAANGECLDWLGALDRKGYGAFGIGSMRDGTRRTVRAHRFAYEATHGPVPKGLELDHLCRNRRCVRVEHLEAVTHAENLRRAREARS
jgi:hypothetical protein